MQSGVLGVGPTGGPHSEALDGRYPQSAAARFGQPGPEPCAARLPSPVVTETRFHGAECSDGSEHSELPEPNATPNATNPGPDEPTGPSQGSEAGASEMWLGRQCAERSEREERTWRGFQRRGEQLCVGHRRKRPVVSAEHSSKCSTVSSSDEFRTRPQPRLPLPESSDDGRHESADRSNESSTATPFSAWWHIHRWARANVRAWPTPYELSTS